VRVHVVSLSRQTQAYSTCQVRVARARPPQHGSGKPSSGMRRRLAACRGSAQHGLPSALGNLGRFEHKNAGAPRPSRSSRGGLERARDARFGSAPIAPKQGTPAACAGLGAALTTASARRPRGSCAGAVPIASGARGAGGHGAENRALKPWRSARLARRRCPSSAGLPSGDNAPRPGLVEHIGWVSIVPRDGRDGRAARSRCRLRVGSIGSSTTLAVGSTRLAREAPPEQAAMASGRSGRCGAALLCQHLGRLESLAGAPRRTRSRNCARLQRSYRRRGACSGDTTPTP